MKRRQIFSRKVETAIYESHRKNSLLAVVSTRVLTNLGGQGPSWTSFFRPTHLCNKITQPKITALCRITALQSFWTYMRNHKKYGIIRHFGELRPFSVRDSYLTFFLDFFISSWVYESANPVFICYFITSDLSSPPRVTLRIKLPKIDQRIPRAFYRTTGVLSGVIVVFRVKVFDTYFTLLANGPVFDWKKKGA